MSKLMKYLYFLCVLCVFAVSAPLLHAETMKPDIIDVQSTFKFKGTDQSNVVNSKVQSVTITSGSVTVATGLGTCTNALFLASTASTGTTTSQFRYTTSGANAIFYAYDIATGATSTSNFSGTGLFYGTP